MVHGHSNIQAVKSAYETIRAYPYKAGRRPVCKYGKAYTVAFGDTYHWVCPPSPQEQARQNQAIQRQNEALRSLYSSPLFQNEGRYNGETIMIHISFTIDALNAFEKQKTKISLNSLSESLRSLAGVARTKGVEGGAPDLSKRLTTSATEAAINVVNTEVGGRLQGNVSDVLELALQTLNKAFTTYQINRNQDSGLIPKLTAAIATAAKLEK